MFIDVINACAKQDVEAAERYFEQMKASQQDFALTTYAPPLCTMYNTIGAYDKSVELLRWALPKAEQHGQQGNIDFIEEIAGPEFVSGQTAVQSGD